MILANAGTRNEVTIQYYTLSRTRHDGAVGEVAGEEVVVDGDVLVTHGVLAVLNLHHAVHKQERVPAEQRNTCVRT